MLQVRLGAGAVAAALVAHTLYVRAERRKAPALMRFSPASQDAVVADALKTGDLVLFARDCTLYTGCAGVVCAARQQLGGDAFDQAAVIVMRDGAPHVLELTARGPRCRPYDARILFSRSSSVIVRPLLSRAGALDADRAHRARVNAFVTAATSGPAATGGAAAAGSPPGTAPADVAAAAALGRVGAASGGVAGMAKELLATPLDAASSNASVAFVLQFYEAVGVVSPSGGAGGGTAAPPRRLGVAELSGKAPGATQRLAAVGLHVGDRVWVRQLRH